MSEIKENVFFRDALFNFLSRLDVHGRCIIQRSR